MRKINRKKIAAKKVAQKRRLLIKKEKYRQLIMRKFIEDSQNNPADPLFPPEFFNYDQEQFIADLDRQRAEYQRLIMRKF